MLSHKVKIPTLTKANIPSYLNEIIFEVTDTKDNEYVIRTPSAQHWNNLSSRQKEKWRELVTLSGEDPEDYLLAMRMMLPRPPKGAE